MTVVEETIAAIATPSGPGGVGVIRLSGPSSLVILEAMSKRPKALFKDRFMQLTAVYDGSESIDEVLAVAMRGPNSFTGEDVVEIHGHGGAANMARLLRTVLGAGARLAQPGEFSRRAFENGRMDLAQAEAIVGIANASSERALRISQRQRAGELSEGVATMRSECAKILAEIEASLDFPEDNVESSLLNQLVMETGELATEARKIANTYELGRVVNEGILVAITGSVNAGKSSLLNALVDSERSLVSEEPGTTRDFLEHRTIWDGIPVTLVDTAGVRDNPSVLERRGLELAKSRIDNADIVVILVPPGEGWRVGNSRELIFRSKADLLADRHGTESVLSSRSGEGLEELKRKILAKCLVDQEQDEGITVASERHRNLLLKTADSAAKAAALLEERHPLEVVAVELRSAQGFLAEILGVDVQEDVLDALFSKFCIGK